MSANEPVASNYQGRPSVCRNCGALVGAGESACAQCGTPLAQISARREAARPAYDSETMTFARAILTRPATFTVVFLVINVLLYILMTISGGATGETLIAYGAKLNSLIAKGEWWRFITPVFLHISLPGFGPMHILMNMYGLWMIGPYVERLYGSAKFVVFWIVSGVAGVLASYLAVRPNLSKGLIGSFLFRAEDGPSAGASGALFGLIGVLFVFGLKFRRELPEGFKRAFGTGMLPVILMNLFIGFLGRGLIDNAAHLGGLLAGAALALVVGYKRPGERGPVSTIWHILQFAALALVVVSFFMVWRSYSGPKPSLSGESLRRGVTGSGPDVAGYLDAINEGQRSFRKSLNETDPEATEQAINKLENAPRLNDKADALRNELKELVVRARDYTSLPAKERETKPSQLQLQQLLTDFQGWQDRFREWVKTDGGQKFGIVFTEDANQNKANEKPQESK